VSDPVPWLDRLAHDLRGPLTPLQTAAYLLRSGQVGAERQQELFALIERQTRQMVGMIDELGDWIRVTQDRLIGPSEPCDVALLLDYARANSGPAGASATLEQHADGVLIPGDPVRLTQMLRILLEYMGARSPATVTVAMRVDDARFHIEVRGAPIDPDHADALFAQPEAEPFDQGLGLRLLIAKAIAEGHGGRLVAEVDGGHLVFRCALPLQAA
jgi:signal transduction histidine kinase